MAEPSLPPRVIERLDVNAFVLQAAAHTLTKVIDGEQPLNTHSPHDGEEALRDLVSGVGAELGRIAQHAREGGPFDDGAGTE